MGFILVEQNQTSVEHTKIILLYSVEQNQTMSVEQNHTMPVEQTSVNQNWQCQCLDPIEISFQWATVAGILKS